MKRFYLLGIGGTGVSALGHYLLDAGNEVSGYDLARSWELKYLLERNISFYENTFDLTRLNEYDTFVKTIAINNEMPIMKTAKLFSKAIYDYPEYLGKITQNHRNVIAICGAHGKTTVAGLCAFLLYKYGLDPSFIIGGVISNFKRNGRYTGSQYLVVEACEFRESFLNLTPHIIIATNIEIDHTDYYYDIDKLKNAYLKFFGKSSVEYIIYNQDSSILNDVISQVNGKIKISFSNLENTNYCIMNFNEGNYVNFTISRDGRNITCVESSLCGYHNAYNVMSAFILCDILKLDSKYFANFVSEFKGMERRMQNITLSGYNFILDYAHHPTQLKNVVNFMAKKYGDNFLVVFQPHQYRRLYYFEKEFLSVFINIKNLILAPVFNAREEYDEGNAINRFINNLRGNNNCHYIHSYSDIATFIKASNFKTILLAGAGDIYRVLDYFNNE